nr:MAG TPA: hypothetical protein [Caudoviricetes sp.]
MERLTEHSKHRIAKGRTTIIRGRITKIIWR